MYHHGARPSNSACLPACLLGYMQYCCPAPRYKCGAGTEARKILPSYSMIEQLAARNTPRALLPRSAALPDRPVRRRAGVRGSGACLRRQRQGLTGPAWRCCARCSLSTAAYRRVTCALLGGPAAAASALTAEWLKPQTRIVTGCGTRGWGATIVHACSRCGTAPVG